MPFPCAKCGCGWLKRLAPLLQRQEYIEINRKLFEEQYKEENRYFRVHLEYGLDKNVYFERLKPDVH